MSAGNYSPTYTFFGDVKGSSAPASADSLVRRQDVAGNSFITSIAGGSSSLLSVSGGALSVESLLVTDVTVDTTHATLAAYVSAGIPASMKTGDILILSAATPSLTYICKVASPAAVGDFAQLNEGTNYTAGSGLSLSGTVFSLDNAAARGLLSASAGVDYNSGTGAITADQGEIRGFFSGGSGVSFNAGSGQFTADQAAIRGFFSASNGVQYNSSTGAFDANQGWVRGRFSGGTGITYNAGTGAIALDNAAIRYAAQNISLSAGVAATVNHNLGQKLVHFSALRTSDSKAVDLEVTYTNNNSLSIKSQVNLQIDLACSL